MVTNNAINVGTAAAGKVLQGAGAGVALTFSTPTYPSASGTSRKILVSDGTNNVYSTETWAVPGANGNVLTSDGTNWTSAAPAAPTFTPNSIINIFDDFVGAQTSSTFINSSQTWLANAFASIAPTSISYPGILRSSAATSAGTSPYLYLGDAAGSPAPSFLLGGGALTVTWVFNIVNLSTGTNTYTLKCGLGNAASNPTNGCYVNYSNGTNSGDWQFICNAAGTPTTSNSTTAVATGFQVIQIAVNAGATSVSFSAGTTVANLASLGTAITTNIPTAVAVSPFIDLAWSAGTIATGSLTVDLMYLTQTLTTAR